MNEAFGKIIGSDPRLKETPFVFGGNMVIHRDLFTVVPFDPEVTRGEDIDFLINAKMFGFKLLSDEYLALGDKGGSKEALNNIIIAKTEAVPKYDLFLWLCKLQKRWHELMRFSSQEEIRSQMRDIVLV